MFKFDKITENLTGFIDTKIELMKLEAKEKIALLLANVIWLVLLLFLISTAIIFASVALSIKINLLLNSAYLGFLVVSFVYFIIVLSFILFVDQTVFYNTVAKKIVEIIEQHKNEDHL